MELLDELAARVRAGDTQAALALRNELEGPLQYIVRRALRAKSTASSLARHIRTQAGSNWAQAEEHGRVRSIADRLCETVLGGLRPETQIGFRLGETVRT